LSEKNEYGLVILMKMVHCAPVNCTVHQEQLSEGVILLR